MGVIIKRNKNGDFQLKSSMSDEFYHESDKWLNLDEAKKVIMDKLIWKFIENIIEVDMDFPAGYHVNGKLCTKPDRSFLDWIINLDKKENSSEILIEKFMEISDRLGLGVKIK